MAMRNWSCSGRAEALRTRSGWNVSCRRAAPGRATWCTWGVSANRVVTYIARPLASSQSWKLAERMFW